MLSFAPVAPLSSSYATSSAPGVVTTPADRVFQLSFRATGETGVLSSSTGSPGLIGGCVVSMKGCSGAALDVVCLTKVPGGAIPESGAAVEGVVSADIEVLRLKMSLQKIVPDFQPLKDLYQGYI